MAFGALQRKSSNPQPYRPAKSRQYGRSKQIRNTAIFACVAVATVWLLLHFFSSSSSRTGVAIPPGTPEVVIVTVFDTAIGQSYAEKIRHNRDDYASRHGYKNFYTDSGRYNLSGAPTSWAMVPALRHALTENPHSTYFFSLSPHSLIMNPELPLTAHVTDNPRLESLMLKDKPVVPPDSVIHTFSHLKGKDIDLVLTQDNEGLCQESFILRQGEWAKFFLDVWFDPMYRSYNFQKAEGHALEHIVQWHPTILTKLALIPQRTINSYTVDIPSRGGKLVTYQENDFVVRAVACEKDPEHRNCERELDPWFNRWKSMYGSKSSL